MARRPNDLNLGKDRREAFEPPRMPFRSDLPSPRTGEAPPALSPLDAFAMQSRMLARRFEEERENGRRISRLPPVMVAEGMSNRPGYFRSMSTSSEERQQSPVQGRYRRASPHVREMADISDDTSPIAPMRGHAFAEEPSEDSRPKSIHPVVVTARDSTASEMIPDMPAHSSGAMPYFPPMDRRQPMSRGQRQVAEQQDYFGLGAPRAASPDPVDARSVNIEAPSPPPPPSLTSSFDTVASHPRTLTNESQRSQRSPNPSGGLGITGPSGLVPPPQQSPRYPRSPRSFQSIRSVPQDSGDEDAGSTISGSQPIGRSGGHGSSVSASNLSGTAPTTTATVSSSRKFSGSSNMSRPQSPFSPWMHPMHRSPSTTSDYSISGASSQIFPPLAPPVRPSANFSRPMSSSGRPSFDTRPSFDARPSIEIRPSFDTRPSTDSRPSVEHYPRPSDLPFRQAGGHGRNTPSVASSLSRQNSADDVPTPYAYSANTAVHNVETPTSVSTEDYFPSNAAPNVAADDLISPIEGPAEGKGPNSTYTYAKYTLPRGRAMERVSAGGIRDSWIQRQFNWDKPIVGATGDTTNMASISQSLASIDASAPSSSPLDGRGRMPRDLGLSTSAVRSRSADPRALNSILPTSPIASHANGSFPSLVQSPPAAEAPGSISKPSALPRVTAEAPSSPTQPKSNHRPTPSNATESTDRTIRGTPLHQKSASTDLTADEHLDIGIAAHSAGQLTKSTYHLRLAAIAGLPTAMLLYALACRHGWGMRAQPEEGVKWLRKAVAITGLDNLSPSAASSFFTSAEARLTHAAQEGQKDLAKEARDRRDRTAQYALAVYELGMSSMHGWGCPKDKKLALRCFEIAGAWGDTDALAEAGFCYTQGIGCKKDLKKAAGLYRKAQERGMSMAGNSWIYKPKYMDDSKDSANNKEQPSAAALLGNSDNFNTSQHSKRPDTAMTSHTTSSFLSRRGADDSDYRPGTSATTATFNSTAGGGSGGGRQRSRSIWGRRKDKKGDGADAPGITPVPVSDADDIPLPLGTGLFSPTMARER